MAIEVDIPALRRAVGQWRAERHGYRIDPAELTRRYNERARIAIGSVQLGRWLTSRGIVAHNDHNKATGKSAGFRHVLDAAGGLLPEWRAVFGEPVSTPAPEDAGTVPYAPGTLLRVTEDGSLVEVSEAGPTPAPATDADSGGTLPSPEAVAAVSARLSGRRTVAVRAE